MELEKVRNWRNKIIIRPVKKKDNRLWRHCTYYKEEVLNKFFKRDVEPLLKAHGVKFLHITDRSRKI